MKFEEDFPSLKRKDIDITIDSIEYPYDNRRLISMRSKTTYFILGMCKRDLGIKESYENMGFERVILLKDVQENCVDKQRLKEFIDKQGKEYPDGLIMGNKLKKELNIE